MIGVEGAGTRPNLSAAKPSQRPKTKMTMASNKAVNRDIEVTFIRMDLRSYCSGTFGILKAKICGKIRLALDEGIFGR